MKLDHATVRVTAINCIIDIFVIFGIHPFLEVAGKFGEVDLDIGEFSAFVFLILFSFSVGLMYSLVRLCC